VPTKAMTRSGQNAVVTANPTPVATISRLAASSSLRLGCRLAMIPTQRVSRAVPIKVAQTIVPIAKALKPSSRRYIGNSRATKPSPKARTPRAARIRIASLEAPFGIGRHHSLPVVIGIPEPLVRAVETQG